MMELLGQLGIFAAAAIALAWTFKHFVPKLMDQQREDLTAERAVRKLEAESLVKNSNAVRELAGAVRDLAFAIRGCPMRSVGDTADRIDTLTARVNAICTEDGSPDQAAVGGL